MDLGLGGHIRTMSTGEGTWFELQPEGERLGGAERYRGRPEAEQAATAMLIRRPELQFVEVAEYETRDGVATPAQTINRIEGAHPPAPSEAEVDDLHKLPRGDPEC
ncbi:MAG TPA: hypothetical protein VFD90_08415 [Gaiellales bacterium]|nr:hypothetical protein [Gaiellales bacterium]